MSKIVDLKNQINDLKVQISAENSSNKLKEKEFDFLGAKFKKLLCRNSEGYYCWLLFMNGEFVFQHLTPEELQMNKSFIDINKIGEKY